MIDVMRQILLVVKVQQIYQITQYLGSHYHTITIPYFTFAIPLPQYTISHPFHTTTTPYQEFAIRYHTITIAMTILLPLQLPYHYYYNDHTIYNYHTISIPYTITVVTTIIITIITLHHTITKPYTPYHHQTITHFTTSLPYS